ncbi:hypothetical protein [Acinetobacter baumannii]|uniref:hypothetical protein n=1 Tax=Acinetobacter baumannii TaxID=470 RepID=UPI0010C7F336|nr:hypothetical protein FDF35_09155 [Acinetobacter baumannii]
MINKVLIVLCVSIVFVLGYWAYLDTQNKRHQELMRIIQEAEKNLQTIERNPNRVSHSNLASYNLQKYISDKKVFSKHSGDCDLL